MSDVQAESFGDEGAGPAEDPSTYTEEDWKAADDIRNSTLSSASPQPSTKSE